MSNFGKLIISRCNDDYETFHDLDLILVKGNGNIIDIDHDKEQQLDCEGDKRGGHARQRDDEAREIDFAEDAGIGSQHVGVLIEAGSEVVPHKDAAEIEDSLRYAASGDACQPAEDEHIHDGGEDGADEKPCQPEDGLFIDRDDVAPHIDGVEVAVVPDLLEV